VDIRSEMPLPDIDTMGNNDCDSDDDSGDDTDDNIDDDDSDTNEYCNSNDSDSDTNLNQSNVVARIDEKSIHVCTRYRREILQALEKQLTSDQLEVWHTYKISTFATFFKYRRLCHADVTLRKLKEDMCDTCIKYKVMLDDEETSETDREKITAALGVRYESLLCYCFFIIS
jgi:hypothetical protein